MELNIVKGSKLHSAVPHAITSDLTHPKYHKRPCYYICYAQSGNLRNLEIVLRILRSLRLRSNLEIAHYSCVISRLHNYSVQSSDCANYAPTASTAS